MVNVQYKLQNRQARSDVKLGEKSSPWAEERTGERPTEMEKHALPDKRAWDLSSSVAWKSNTHKEVKASLVHTPRNSAWQVPGATVRTQPGNFAPMSACSIQAPALLLPLWFPVETLCWEAAVLDTHSPTLTLTLLVWAWHWGRCCGHLGSESENQRHPSISQINT